MREILFRGKLISGRGWSYGYLSFNPHSGIAIMRPDDTLLGSYGQVDRDTVGQYTGLTDKNGNKIFEGDILKSDAFVGVVEYDNSIAAFIVKINDSTANWCHWSPLNEGDITRSVQLQYTEIIGNIHDNPGLLESEDIIK